MFNVIIIIIIIIYYLFGANIYMNIFKCAKCKQSNLCTTVPLGKWQDDQYTGWLLYTGQLAEGKRQQKILGSCLVTATYKAVYTGVTVYIILFTSWEVGTGRNCAWGRPQVVLRSRLRAQFLPIQTSQPLNNIFIVFLLKLKSFRKFTLAFKLCVLM